MHDTWKKVSIFAKPCWGQVTLNFLFPVIRAQFSKVTTRTTSPVCRRYGQMELSVGRCSSGLRRDRLSWLHAGSYRTAPRSAGGDTKKYPRGSPGVFLH